jgi:hypothetical protein
VSSSLTETALCARRMLSKWAYLCFALWLSLPLAAGADEMLRPTSYDDFQAATNQTHYFVPGSQLAWANYVALRRDFPQLDTLSEAQIDHWILSNFSYVSELELKLRGLRVSDFHADLANAVQFIHPPGYNRASVALAHVDASGNPVTDKSVLGLVDLKGTGHGVARLVKDQIEAFKKISPNDWAAIDSFHTHDHSDGMMTLGEAIAETSRQLGVQAGFDIYNAKHGTSFQTVESYFIIRLPIQVLKTGLNTDPAAIYARQAHLRGKSRIPAPAEVYIDDFGQKQGSLFESAVDFGGVVITQPDLQKTFGTPESVRIVNRTDAQKSNAWIYGHETATAFVNLAGQDPAAARHAVNEHLAIMLSPLAEKLHALVPESTEVAHARYLYSRFNLRDEGAVHDAIQNFVQLDPQAIAAFLPSLFLPESHSITVANVLQTLLASPHFNANPEARQELLKYAKTFVAGQKFPHSGVYVTGVILDDIEASKNPPPIEDLLQMAFVEVNGGMRTQILRILKRVPLEELVKHLPEVINSKITGSFVAPYLQMVLENPRLAKEYPASQTYIVEQIKKFTGVNHYEVAKVLLNFLERTNSQEFVQYADTCLRSADIDMERIAIHSLFMHAPREALARTQVVLTHCDPLVLTSFLVHLRDSRLIDTTSRQYAGIVKQATNRLQNHAAELDSALNLVPDEHLRHFQDEILTAVNNAKDGKAEATAEAYFLRLDSRSQNDLLPKLLATSAGTEWLLSHAEHWSFNKQIYKLAIEQDGSAPEVANARAMMFRSNSLQPMLKLLKVDQLMGWLNTDKVYVQTQAAYLLGARSKSELGKAFEQILRFKDSVVPAAFANVYFKSLPEGSAERYLFVKDYFASVDKSNPSLVNPILIQLTHDSDPRVLPLVREFIYSRTQTNVVDVLKNRSVSELIAIFPELARNASLESILLPLAEKIPHLPANDLVKFTLVKILLTQSDAAASSRISRALWWHYSNLTQCADVGILTALSLYSPMAGDSSGASILLDRTMKNSDSSLAIWKTFLDSAQPHPDLLREFQAKLPVALAASAAERLAAPASFMCKNLFVQ